MFLDTDNLIYHLIIELEATIDNVLLQSNCSINLIDIENNNTAVVSKSKCREEVINTILMKKTKTKIKYLFLSIVFYNKITNNE